MNAKTGGRWAGVCLVASFLAGAALVVLYVTGGLPHADGVLLATALGGLGAALVVWAKTVLPREEVVDERVGPSSPADREAAEAALAGGETEIRRRRLLTRMLVAAAGALGVSAILPLGSLGPRPGEELTATPWRAGRRLVDGDGRPVDKDTLEVDGVATVFPEGHVGSATGSALLVRVDAGRLRLPAARRDWTPGGYLAYSKLCTHAGCPVCCFETRDGQVVCPCHKTAFDVLTGGKVLSGPAARDLPQLPIEIDGDGHLRATGGFSAPVGPQFWDQDREGRRR